MPKKQSESSTIKSLEAENRRLKSEIERLKKLSKNGNTQKTRRKLGWQGIAAIFLVGLTVAVLIVGNLLFWVGNTVVKPDRYAATVEPLIKDSEVQKSIALYATDQLYQNVDVETFISETLPPRAQILAPTLSDQLRSKTNETFQKILATPKFQDRYNSIQTGVHAKFISSVEKSGGDGVIDLNEVYQQLNDELKNTKLSFLADKQLPSKVGSITVAEGDNLAVLSNVINNIDLWRSLAVLLLIGAATLSIWLSRRRRRAVIRLSLIAALCLLITLVSIGIAKESIAAKADPNYAGGVSNAVQIVTNPLIVQTRTLLATTLLIALVAWLSGPTKSATAFKNRFSELLSGRLHEALFGGRENGFTTWLGKFKRQVEWSIVAIIGIVCLFVRLTPGTLLTATLVLLLLIIVIEVLAADNSSQKTFNK